VPGAALNTRFGENADICCADGHTRRLSWPTGQIAGESAYFKRKLEGVSRAAWRLTLICFAPGYRDIADHYSGPQ
jgi:hypothetical protein